MISIQKNNDLFAAKISNQDTLPHLSIVLQDCVEWFLIHGVNFFSITRRQGKDACVLVGKALVRPKPLLFSSAVLFKGLVEAGYFPKTMQELFESDKELEGVTRISGRLDIPRETSIVVPQVDINNFVFEFAYGQADLITSLFVKGATLIKIRGSVEKIVTWCDVGMSDDELTKFMVNPGSYDPNTTIGELPEILI
jgi:hypothetical protein